MKSDALRRLALIVAYSFIFVASAGEAPGQDRDGAETTVTVRGIVYDEETLEPLPLVNVVILGDPNAGAVTDFDGVYRLRRITRGKQTVKVTHPGYYLQDTIHIHGTCSDTTINFALSGQVPMSVLMSKQLTGNETFDLLSYRDSLHAFQTTQVPLNITIDSMWWTHDRCSLNAALTFSNRSILALYALKNFNPCLTRTELILVGSEGDTLRPGSINIDCIGEKVRYEESDLIRIAPSTSVRYFTCFDGATRVPEDSYHARVIYEYRAPRSYSWDYFPNKSGIIAALKALEGVFQSDNQYELTVPARR